MSNIIINYDTSEKKCYVTIDGVEIPNVRNVSLYSDYDNPEKKHIDVNMEEKVGDIDVFTSLVASDNDEIKSRRKDKTIGNIDDYPRPNFDDIAIGVSKMIGKKY